MSCHVTVCHVMSCHGMSCHVMSWGRWMPSSCVKHIDMGWLWFVGSIKLQVSLTKETYKRDDILQKRPIILSILLTVATPYESSHMWHVSRHDTSHTSHGSWRDAHWHFPWHLKWHSLALRAQLILTVHSHMSSHRVTSMATPTCTSLHMTHTCALSWRV